MSLDLFRYYMIANRQLKNDFIRLEFQQNQGTIKYNKINFILLLLFKVYIISCSKNNIFLVLIYSQKNVFKIHNFNYLWSYKTFIKIKRFGSSSHCTMGYILTMFCQHCFVIYNLIFHVICG